LDNCKMVSMFIPIFLFINTGSTVQFVRSCALGM
jgi:hypothetical protein